MPDTYIQLNRTFYDLADTAGDGEEAVDYSFLRYYAGFQFGWQKLLESRDVVILGEAGSGKTSEFRAQARALSRVDRPAFFVRIESLATEGLAQSISREDVERLEQWRESEAEALFFLDSVDEAKLLPLQHPLEKALRNLRNELGAGFDRTRLFISCRASDWRFKNDLALVKELRPRGDEDVQESQSPSFIGKSSNSHGVSIVCLAPLDRDQIRLLAGHYGVTNVDEFLTAIDDADADDFVARPLDVVWLASHWRRHGQLGTLTELLDGNIREKLSEQSPDRPPSPLIPEEANMGAKVVAAASVLCKCPYISLPIEAQHPGYAISTLNAHECLPRWEATKIRELLTRPIFDVPTFGRARFHHRSTSEYLAAKWMEERLSNGCPFEQIEAVFFGQGFDGTVIRASRAGTLGWLSNWNATLRERVLEVAPEILLLHGDPQENSVSDRCRALRALAERYGDRRYTGLTFGNAELKRFANPALTDTILELLDSYRNAADVRALLLRIIRAGHLSGAADAVAAIAMDPLEDDHVRHHAIRALSAIGSDKQLNALAAQFCAAEALPNRSIGEAIDALYPRYLDLDACFTLIAGAEREIFNASSGLEDSVTHGMVPRCPSKDLPNLLQRLLGFAAVEPTTSEGKSGFISKRFWWVTKPIGATLMRLLPLPEAQQPFENMAAACDLLSWCDLYQPQSYMKDKDITEAMCRHPEFRRRYYWHRVETLRSGDSEKRIFLSTFREEGPCPVMKDDFAWLLDEVSARPEVADREAALEGALHAWRLAGMLDDQAEQLLHATSDVADLQSTVRRWTDPPPEEETEHAKKWRRKREARQKAEQEALEISRERLTGRIEGIQTGSDAGALVYLFQRLQHHGLRRSDGTPLNLKTLESEFGPEIIEAAKDGFMAFWRLWAPLLRHEMPEVDRNKTEYVVSVGLAGLEMAADRGLDFSALSHDDAVTAARYATYELNGFPAWFPDLVEAHPDAILQTLGPELKDEYWTPADISFPHHVLSTMEWHGGNVADLCAPTFLDLLEGGDPNHLRALWASLSVVLRSDSIDRHRITALAADRATTAMHSNALDQAIPWLVAWLYLGADAAWTFVEAQIETLGTESKPFIISLMAALKEPFERREDTLNANYIRPAVLLRMIPAAYRFVNPDEDVWHEQVYTPGTRDKAAGMREALVRLLGSIPGPEAYQALVRLAELPEFAQWRDGFLVRAEQHVLDSVDNDVWTPVDLLNFAATKKHYELKPYQPHRTIYEILSDLYNRYPFIFWVLGLAITALLGFLLV